MRVAEKIVLDPMAVAITSIVKTGQTLYLGLTGGRNILARYDIDSDAIDLVEPVFPWAQEDGMLWKIHNALNLDPAGRLIIGEGRSMSWDGLPGGAREGPADSRITTRRERTGLPIDPDRFGIKSLAEWDRRKSAPGGHLVRYDPANGKHEDFGLPVPLTYIHSLVYDDTRQRAYGHTIPGNHFFVADLKSKQLINHGRISRFSFHYMAVAPDGKVFGSYIASGGKLRLLEYDPDKDHLSRTDSVILMDPGAAVQGNIGLDAWCVTRRGEMYFGTVANALLHRLHYQDRRVELLGQAPGQQRIATMCEGEDDVLYLTVGFPHAHVVRYDTRKAKFEDLGTVCTEVPMVYFHADAWDDGVLYLGETDGFSPSLWRIEI